MSNVSYSNFLITGFHGKPHVTAESDRGIYASIFGKGRFVLPVGEQFRTEVIGDNKIRMYDGKLVDNGAVAGIAAGEYIDILSITPSQGKLHVGFIYFQYTKDSSTLIENGTFGLVMSGGYEDVSLENISKIIPKLYQEDLLTGTATRDQMPLHVVYIDTREGDIQINVQPCYEVWSRTDEKFQADINDLYEKYAIVGKAAETCGKNIASLSADITTLNNASSEQAETNQRVNQSIISLSGTCATIMGEVNKNKETISQLEAQNNTISTSVSQLETKHNNQMLSVTQRLQVLENAPHPVVGAENISEGFIVGVVQSTNVEYEAIVYRSANCISGTIYLTGNLSSIFDEFGILCFDINSDYSIMGETHCNFYCENSAGEIIVPNMLAVIQYNKLAFYPLGDIDNSDLTVRASFSYICGM